MQNDNTHEEDYKWSSYKVWDSWNQVINNENLLGTVEPFLTVLTYIYFADTL